MVQVEPDACDILLHANTGQRGTTWSNKSFTAYPVSIDIAIGWSVRNRDPGDIDGSRRDHVYFHLGGSVWDCQTCERHTDKLKCIFFFFFFFFFFNVNETHVRSPYALHQHSEKKIK